MARIRMNITGVILAAGTSSRMGSVNKLLLEYNDHTVIEETLAQLSNSDVNDIIIVTGHEHEQMQRILAKHLTDRVRLVYNANYLRGRSESIKRAIEHIGNRADAALFMVADKPGVSTALINRAIDRYRADRPAILYVEPPGGRGHPIIFAKTLFEDLSNLKGDLVGNELVSKYADDLVKLKDDTPQIDIDNEQDYHILLQSDAGKEIP